MKKMKLRMYAIVLGLLGVCVHGMDEQGEEERKGIQYAHQVLTTGFVGVDKVARPRLPKNLQAIVYEYANVYEAQHSIPLPEHYGLAVGNRGDEGTAFQFRAELCGSKYRVADIWIDYATGKQLKKKNFAVGPCMRYSNGHHLLIDRTFMSKVFSSETEHFDVGEIHCLPDRSILVGVGGPKKERVFVHHTKTRSTHYYPVRSEVLSSIGSSALSSCGTRFALGFDGGVVQVFNIGARVHNKHSSLIDATPTTFKYRARGSCILVKFLAGANHLVVATEERLSLWQLPEHNALYQHPPIRQSKQDFGPLEYPHVISSDGSKAITLRFDTEQSYVAGVYSVGTEQGISSVKEYDIQSEVSAAYSGSVVAASSDARHIVLTEPVRRMTVLQLTCGYKKYLEQQQSRFSCTKLMHAAKQYTLAYGVHAAVTASAIMAAWSKWY